MASPDALMFAMEWAYEKFYEECITSLEDDEPSLNPGQQVIFQNEVMPLAEEYLNEAAIDWPWIDATEFVDYVIYNSYHVEVVERSMTYMLSRPVDKMERHVYRAQRIAAVLDALGF